MKYVGSLHELTLITKKRNQKGSMGNNMLFENIMINSIEIQLDEYV